MQVYRDLQEDDYLWDAWQYYNFCRILRLEQYGGLDEPKIVYLPAGWSCLPKSGGLDDQPFHLVELFLAFEEGERQAAYELLRRS